MSVRVHRARSCTRASPSTHSSTAIRPQVIATPVRRPRNRDVGLALGSRLPRHGAPNRFVAAVTASSSSSREPTGSTLRAGPGAHPASARAGRRSKRHCRLRGACSTGPSIRTCRCIASQWITAAARGLSVELPPLARQIIGVEDEVPRHRHHLFAQHHPRRRPARRVAGGQHHGIGVRLMPVLPSLCHPAVEDDQGLGRQGLWEQLDVSRHVDMLSWSRPRTCSGHAALDKRVGHYSFDFRKIPHDAGQCDPG